MAGHQNTVATARLVLGACARAGVPAEVVLEDAGTPVALMADAEGMVSREQMWALWESAERRTGDSAIGLAAGSFVPPGTYGVLDFIIAHSATVGEGLGRLAEVMPIVNTWALLDTADDPDRGRLWIEAAEGSLPRAVSEFCAAIVVTLGQRCWQMDFQTAEVRFDFTLTDDEPPDRHESTLGCPVTFGCPRTEIVFTREVWDRKIRASDPGLVAALVAQAEALLARLPGSSPFLAQVRSEVERRLPDRAARLESVAAGLAMSGRTLQRRLADEGTTFAQVVDEVRLAAAEVRLTDPTMSLAAIAYLLGFDEQSSFSRAFKRWTGESPAHYRARLG